MLLLDPQRLLIATRGRSDTQCAVLAIAPRRPKAPRNDIDGSIHTRTKGLDSGLDTIVSSPSSSYQTGFWLE